jgi:hypothetical protein
MEHTFRDSPFMSARDKALVLKAWVRFLKSGLRYAYFTKLLYHHLMQHCSFIAHYDRYGFFTTYFEQGEDAARFLSQFDARGECRSVEYGGGYWISGEYEDINRAMVEEGKAYIPSLIDRVHADQREADIATARALLRKHGIS